MVSALEIAIGVLWARRPGEAAMLLGATEVVRAPCGPWTFFYRWQLATTIEGDLADGDLNEQRMAGHNLSLVRAVDLALRIVEEEQAAAKLDAQASTATEVPRAAEGAPEAIPQP